jgi:hypothetical protein
LTDVAPSHVACSLWVNSLTSRAPFASVTWGGDPPLSPMGWRLQFRPLFCMRSHPTRCKKKIKKIQLVASRRLLAYDPPVCAIFFTPLFLFPISAPR